MANKSHNIKTKLIPITWLGTVPHGYANGYVGVPNGHPWYQKDYNSIEVSIHGGLTYGDFGVGNPPKDKNLWWVGFDTAHYGDNSMTCGKSFCEAEVQSLLEQAIEAADLATSAAEKR